MKFYSVNFLYFGLSLFQISVNAELTRFLERDAHLLIQKQLHTTYPKLQVASSETSGDGCPPRIIS